MKVLAERFTTGLPVDISAPGNTILEDLKCLLA
jgi:hypothetical protein